MNKENAAENLDFQPSNAFEKQVLALLAEINEKLGTREKTLEEISNDLLTPKEAWGILKINKTRFYTLINQGYITLVRFDYSGNKTFVKRSELALLFQKDFRLECGELKE